MDRKVVIGLVDAALSGDKQEIQMAVRRLASKMRLVDEELYKDVCARLEVSALRSASFHRKPLPVDSDSRLNLVRVEDPVIMDRPPIYSDAVRVGLLQVVQERIHAELLLKELISPSRSLIFEGPPGVGKTMSARWLAKQLNLPLLTLDLAAVMSSFLGKTGSNVRMVLDYAASCPCVLLLDEFDAVAKRRDDDRELGELKRLVTVLLQAIDEWPDTSLLIAATNHGELLDPAIWRRFDREIRFELPTQEQIENYISSYWPEFWVKHKNSGLQIFEGKSFSYVDREMRRMKRESILSGLSLEVCFNSSDAELDYSSLSLADKKSLVGRLYAEGKSQREISVLLGISRPTVKKALLN